MLTKLIEFSIINHAFLWVPPRKWKPPFRQRLIYPLESQTRSSTAASWPTVHLGAGRQSHYLGLWGQFIISLLFIQSKVFWKIYTERVLCFVFFRSPKPLDLMSQRYKDQLREPWQDSDFKARQSDNERRVDEHPQQVPFQLDG